MVKVSATALAMACMAYGLGSAEAHNGAAATAINTFNITVDGDLSEWQDKPALGLCCATGSQSGRFWTAFDKAAGYLYVAVEIRDDKVSTNGPGSLDLYVEPRHDLYPDQPAQFFYRDQPGAFRPVHRGLATVYRRMSRDGLTYEWQIPLEALLAKGETVPAVIGFDLSYHRSDSGPSAPTLSWGTGANKASNTEELGDLFLESPSPNLLTLVGRADWPRTMPTSPSHVRIRMIGNPSFAVQVTTSADGHFQAQLPAGSYELRAWDERTLERLSPPVTVDLRSNTVLTQPLKAEFLSAPIETYLPELMGHYRVPAVGIAIIDQGTISYQRTFGRDENGRPATSDTLFHVASLSKPIATMVALALVDKAILKLDEPLSHYWVDPDLANDPRLSKITARLVLQHRTGLPNWRGAQGLRFMEDPDVGWSYSGEGFEYLRHAMEKLTGRSLEDLAKDYVFKPAGMSHTTYIWNDWVAQNYAGEYYRMGEPLTYSRPSTPNAAASLITTVGDYANFGIWVMNGAGLSKGLQREMVAAQKGPPFGLLQGLGWVVTHDAAGRLILNHGGSQTGIRAQVLLSPETKSGLVIFTNGSNGTPIIRAVLNSTMNKHGGLGQIDRMLPQWGSGGL